MFKYLSFFLIAILLLAFSNNVDNKEKKRESAERDFNRFGYIYHFIKEELEKSGIEPSAFKPKVFDISGTVLAKVYSGDTMVRFVYKSKSEKYKSDSSVEFLKPVKLTSTDNAKIPAALLGCHLIGVYYSLDEDVPDNFFQCIYINENGDLLRVVHLFKPGNVSGAFFYTEKNIDPTDRYKGDIAKLLSIEQKLNLKDSVHIKFE